MNAFPFLCALARGNLRNRSRCYRLPIFLSSAFSCPNFTSTGFASTAFVQEEFIGIEEWDSAKPPRRKVAILAFPFLESSPVSMLARPYHAWISRTQSLLPPQNSNPSSGPCCRIVRSFQTRHWPSYQSISLPEHIASNRRLE